MDKSQMTTVSGHDIEVNEQLVREKSGISKDAEDMRRLGRMQELRVILSITRSSHRPTVF